METSKIDKQIATLVMGWYRDELGPIIGPYPAYILKDNHHILCKNWHPSTDIAQAFEVLDKFETAWELFKNDYGEYSCNIYIHDLDYVNGGYEKTPALAICKAALEAVKPIDTTSK